MSKKRVIPDYQAPPPPPISEYLTMNKILKLSSEAVGDDEIEFAMLELLQKKVLNRLAYLEERLEKKKDPC